MSELISNPTTGNPIGPLLFRFCYFRPDGRITSTTTIGSFHVHQDVALRNISVGMIDVASRYPAYISMEKIWEVFDEA